MRRVVLCLSFVLVLLAIESSFAAEKIQPAQPDIVLNNFGEGYRCTLWINNEPVYSSSSFFLRSWTGFPIKRGENEFRFEAQSLRPDATVTTSAEISSSNRIKSVKLTLAKPNIDATENFRLEVRPAPPTMLFDDLGGATNEIETLKQFAVDISQRLSRRDFRGMAALLRVNEMDLRLAYPRWVSEATKTLENSAVTTSKDIETLIGKRLIVIRSTIDYARAKSPALASVKSAESDAEVALPCITFCKQADAWFCLGPGSQWARIQDSLKPPATSQK